MQDKKNVVWKINKMADGGLTKWRIQDEQNGVFRINKMADG